MEIREILKRTDHTLLKPSATLAELEQTARDAVSFGCASVCIPPFFVERAREICGSALAVCTVIGFPCGYNSDTAKLYEAKAALKDGADELDIVINVCKLKSGETESIKRVIDGVRSLAQDKTVKVIIETGLLTEQEKITACRIVSDSPADYIKTSTGFAGGATVEDVELIKRNIRPDLKIKASGGIRTLEQAAAFINLGCDRIGASALIAAAVKEGYTI